MIAGNNRSVASVWNFLPVHEVSPLRTITDLVVRLDVLQTLELVSAGALSIAIGGYPGLATGVSGHMVLLAAAAIAVATLSIAAKTSTMIEAIAGPGSGGRAHHTRETTRGYP